MKCVFCKSGEVVRNGKRARKVGMKQSYLCMACDRQFVEPDGFERMRYKSKVILRAVHMHNDGLSLSKVQNHLWQYDNVRVSRRTISMWHKKYSIFLKSNPSRSNARYQRKDPRR
jgi:transposase-like protein